MGSNPRILPRKRLQVEPGRARPVTARVVEYTGCYPFSSVKVQGMQNLGVCINHFCSLFVFLEAIFFSQKFWKISWELFNRGADSAPEFIRHIDRMRIP